MCAANKRQTNRESLDAAAVVNSVALLCTEVVMIRLWILLLVCTTAVQGVHDCVRTSNYRCRPGNNDFDVRYCGLDDGDLGDLGVCLDQIGRSSIETISLDDNDFVHIPDDLLEGLTSLVRIRLNHLPNLRTLPEGLFAGLGSLVKISMRDNALETLPEGLFSGLPLRIIYMDHNPIVQLPGKLYAGLTSLKKLRMRDIWLEELDDDLFAGLTSLEQLYFYENNKDISIPNHIFRDNVNLEILYLNDNNCGFLHGTLFSGMSKLKVLRLNDNELTFLAGTIFEDLEQLTELDMSGNPDLDCIPPSAADEISKDSGISECSGAIAQ